ncbi:DUF3108 domain-containing protein [Deinococcota bacterium DY0809b]
MVLVKAPVLLKYKLSYAGREAGEQQLRYERTRAGSRMTLTADVALPLPRTKQRWVSEMDARGVPLKFSERVEGRQNKVYEVEFLRGEGVVVTRGEPEFVLPYTVDYHDPLSLILALGAAEEDVLTLPLLGGRVHAERVGEETLALPWGDVQARAWRLRPGVSLIYYDPEGYPLRFSQQVGGHVFEAELTEVVHEPEPEERPEKKKKSRRRGGRRRRRRR